MSYPKIYALGHRALEGLLSEPVRVEEKVDGSQITFWRDEDGVHLRSRGKLQSPAPDKMFEAAWKTVQELDLLPSYKYHGEYLNRPKHNTLTYSRVPERGIVLFDIRQAGEFYLSREGLCLEGRRLGLEVVPLLASGKVTAENIEPLLETESFLGGCNIEGVVVKSYTLFDHQTGKAMMGKYVSPAFVELNKKDFRERNPSHRDIVDRLCKAVRTEARWAKAVQRLRDNGALQQAPEDIGPLIKEVQRDLKEEEWGYVIDALAKAFWGKIERASTSGLAQWYKKQLLDNA